MREWEMEMRYNGVAFISDRYGGSYMCTFVWGPTLEELRSVLRKALKDVHEERLGMSLAPNEKCPGEYGIWTSGGRTRLGTLYVISRELAEALGKVEYLTLCENTPYKAYQPLVDHLESICKKFLVKDELP